MTLVDLDLFFDNVNMVNIAFCAYTRSGYQVSVFRTKDPLVPPNFLTNYFAPSYCNFSVIADKIKICSRYAYLVLQSNLS